MSIISNSLKEKLLCLADSRTDSGTTFDLTQEETDSLWPSSGEFDFMSEEYLTTQKVNKLDGSFPVALDDNGFVGHAGFQDRLDTDKFSYKEFHLKDEKFSVGLPYCEYNNSLGKATKDSIVNDIIDEIQKEVFIHCVHTIFKLAGEPHKIDPKHFISTSTPLALTLGAEKELMKNHQLEYNSNKKFYLEGREVKVVPYSDTLGQILSEDAETAFCIFRLPTSEIQKTNINLNSGVELSFKIKMDIQVNNEKSSILLSIDK